MAIADDIAIDYVNKRISYTGTFTGAGIAPSRYTVNELYSYLQDVFDEPEQMDDPIPMSAQTPTQYTILYPWFIDYKSLKALYSGSLQSSDWSHASTNGITLIYWASGSTTAPTDTEIGEVCTQATSGATGVILKVDATRTAGGGGGVVWIRNTSTTQFDTSNNITSTTTDFDPDGAGSVNSGEAVWSNVYSVGTVQADTEIYVGQEDDYLGGTTIPKLTQIVSWWDSDTDFTASTLGVSSGHFDVLIATKEGGVWIDDLNAGSSGRLAVFARQGDTVYSHFEFLGAVGNFVVPFASTGFDINQEGFYRMTTTDHGNGYTVGEIITGATTGKARITNLFSSTTIDYVLVGIDQADFGDTDLITGEDSTQTATRITGAATDINGAVAIDCNNQPLANVYQHVMYLTRRGATAGILPGPGSTTEQGQFYRGAGDAYIETNAEGVALTEGQTVIGSSSSAEAELVAYYWSGAVGYLIVTNVKGSFTSADTITDEGTGSVSASTNQSNLVDVNAAPFGSFAGGRFFVARGVVLTNVPAADNNNWQTSDVTGGAFQPPTTISITFAGLESGDRATIFEVATSGGDDIVKTTVGVASGAVGAALVVLDANVEQDVPSVGWIRVVDTSATDGTEWRMEYSSYATTNVTLRTVTQPGATADAGGSTTTIVDVGIAPIANFGDDGYPKIGMLIRNTDDTEYSVIIRRIDDDTLEVSNNGTTWASKNYDFNLLPILLDAADTCYFPYIDDVAAASTISKSIKYAADTEIIVRARFSSPDISADRILPFEQKGQKIENSNLTVTAIRTDDPIAS